MTAGLKHLDSSLKADGNALLNAMQQFAGAMGTAIVSAIIGASQAGTVGNTLVKTAAGSQWALLVLLVASVGALGCMIIGLNLNKTTTVQ